jgi:predicted DNA-binding protein (MmcQ/YjbR family)
MDLSSLRDYLGAKPGASEDLPFGPEVLVLKVVGKMFALIAWQEMPLTLSLKAEPQQALLWRELYPAVTPGYHLNKQHWNTVRLDGSVPDEVLRRMMDDSWQRVVAGLKKSERQALLGPPANG